MGVHGGGHFYRIDAGADFHRGAAQARFSSPEMALAGPGGGMGGYSTVSIGIDQSSSFTVASHPAIFGAAIGATPLSALFESALQLDF